MILLWDIMAVTIACVQLECHYLLYLVFSFSFFFLLFFFTYSSLGQPFLLKEVSLSDSVVPENTSDTRSLPDIHSGSVALEVVTVAPLLQRLSDAEVPIWKLLEGRDGKDNGKNCVGKGSKPLCGG